MHQLEMIGDKASMAYFGKTPWHGLGELAPDNLKYDYDGFMNLANLNRQVVSEPLFTSDGLNSGYNGIRYAGEKVIHGVVSPKYKPLQNVDAFKFFQVWLDKRVAMLHTAGALYDGARVWILAQIAANTLEVALGDAVAAFILLSNSHDGKSSVRVGFTPIRVVCANTLASAFLDEASSLIRIRHSKDVKDNLNNIQTVMDVANSKFVATVEQYQLLSRKQINAADLEKYVKVVFGFDKKEKEDGELSTKSKNILKDILKTVDSGVGQDVVSTRGSIYWAYNGVNNYLNYSGGRNNETAIDKLWFGANAGLNRKALDAALALAV